MPAFQLPHRDAYLSNQDSIPVVVFSPPFTAIWVGELFVRRGRQDGISAARDIKREGTTKTSDRRAPLAEGAGNKTVKSLGSFKQQ